MQTNIQLKTHTFLQELLQDNLIANLGDFLAVRAEDKIYTTSTKKLAKDISANDNLEILEDDFYKKIFALDAKTKFLLKTSTRFINTLGLSKKIQPPVLDDMAQILGATIKNYANSQTSKIYKRLKRHGVVLLHSGHALITGKSEDDLIAKSLILDKATTIFVSASVLGGSKPLPMLDSVLMNVVYTLQYSKQTENAQKNQLNLPEPSDAKEIEMRNIIKASGLKLLEENLVQRTWGNTSLRLDDKHFLVTPSGIDYVQLQPNQCGVVEIDNPKNWTARLKPSGERKIHAGVLRLRPEVNAVIHSHPVYAGIFASADIDLPVEDEADKEILGADKIKVSSYGLPGTKKLTKAALEALGDKAKATILKSHGIIAVGKDMDDAFLTVKTLEQACKKYIEKQTEKLTGKPYSDANLAQYFLTNLK